EYEMTSGIVRFIHGRKKRTSPTSPSTPTAPFPRRRSIGRSGSCSGATGIPSSSTVEWGDGGSFSNAVSVMAHTGHVSRSPSSNISRQKGHATSDTGEGYASSTAMLFETRAPRRRFPAFRVAARAERSRPHAPPSAAMEADGSLRYAGDTMGRPTKLANDAVDTWLSAHPGWER